MEGLINIDKVCRTCLKESDSLISIFCDDLQQNIKIANMISSCTVTKVSETDGLPSRICVKCIQDVRTSFVFKLQCEQSYQKLQKYFEQYLKRKPTPSDAHPMTPKMEDGNEKFTQTDEIAFYPCEQCEMKFINQEDLRTHRNEHKGEQVKCRMCPKYYSRLNHLRRHIAIAHPDHAHPKSLSSSYKCDVCEQQFVRIDHLRSHMLTKHGQVMKKIRVKREDCEKEESDGEESCDNSGLSFTKDNSYEHLEEAKFENAEYMNDTNTSFVGLLTEIKIEPAIVSEMNEDIKETSFESRGELDEDHEEFEMLDAEVNMYGSDTDDVKLSVTDVEEDDIEEKTQNEVSSEEMNISNNPEEEVEDDLQDVEVKNENKLVAIIKNKRGRKSGGATADKEFECDICKKTFTRSTHLKRHLLTHSHEKPLKCPQCGKGFTRADHLSLHMIHHSDLKPHICDLCNKSFKRSEHLKRHKETKHADKSTVKKTEICEICHKGFTTAKYLQIHMRMHSGTRVFPCKFCPEQFTDKTVLNEHTKLHVNEKPFLCSECGLRFVRNDYLVIHMRRHKGEKPYKCKFCGKGFPRATDLTVHERYHTGEKSHLCTICGKSFHRAYNLLVHTRVHTGERPYQCPHCSKSFAQGNDLKAHVRRHTGERYKCEICGDGFIQGYNLTHHKRTVHNIDAQSHIRRVEKFTTPLAQQQQVLLQQHQQQLEFLQKQQSQFENQQMSEGKLQLRNPKLEQCIADTHERIAETERQLADLTQQLQQQEEEQQEHLEQHLQKSEPEENNDSLIIAEQLEEGATIVQFPGIAIIRQPISNFAKIKVLPPFE